VSNKDVVHKQVEMEYDLFQLCMLFGMKIIFHGQVFVLVILVFID